MSRNTIAALAVAALLCVAGVAGATGAATPGASAPDQTDDQSISTASVDASATIENDTLVVSVTAGGSAAENVSVSYDDQTKQTDAEGTAGFALSDDDEAEIELETDGFEGELEYGVADGSLTLLEEEYEYDRDVEENEEDAEDDEAEDGDDAEEDDADEAGDDEAEESEDDAEDDEDEEGEDGGEDEEEEEDDGDDADEDDD